jgi:shikimate dehydrogenase
MKPEDRPPIRPLVAGVIGWPIHQSKSPLIHRHWLKHCGVDGDYVRFAVSPGQAAQALKSMAALNIVGLQATMPHKQDCYSAVDHLTNEARQLGAVNTIVRQADGTLLGHNTDMEGFLEPLQSVDLSGQAVTILGAGGAAAAITAGLATKQPARITIVNRSKTSVDAMLAHIGAAVEGIDVRYCHWDAIDSAVVESALVANATSLGMVDQPPLPLDPAVLNQATIVYDIVTNPSETPLLRAARSRGLRNFDGIDMLIGQARSAFALFYGTEAPRSQDQTLKALLRA